MSTSVSVGIVPRGAYDLQNLRDGAVTIPIAQRVDVAAAKQMTLEIWLHEGRIPDGASIAVCAAADGYSPEHADAGVQTKTAKGEDIARLEITGKISFPYFQTLPVPVEHVPRVLAVVLEVRGAKEGPRFSLTIDLIMRESGGATIAAEEIEPIVTTPDLEDSASAPATHKIAMAARMPIAAAPRRYPRWREIVV